jgi:hypothetical protein
MMIVGGIITVIAISLFAYLMWYVSPEEVIERVKVITVTEQGCIVETFDGHAINIQQCNADPGQFINAKIDQKVKERANLMNPTK